MRQLADDQIRELASIDAPTISNAIERFEVRCPTEGFMGPEIRCFFPDLGVVVGYIVTVTADTTTASKTRELQIAELLRAIEDSYKPVVVAVKAEGARPGSTCVIGDLITLMMRRIGAIGVVTDGCIRDVRAVGELGFHAFASGTVVSHGLPSITKVNEPVEISGVRLEPGDLVHGDENGMLKMPWECVESLADEAAKISAEERNIVAGLKAVEIPANVRAFFCGDEAK